MATRIDSTLPLPSAWWTCNFRLWPVVASAVLLWLACSENVQAAAAPTADQYITEVWQVEQGLPGNNATSLAQTPDGYLWVGTQSGLARFDGVRFDIFHAPALENRQISRLFVDQHGALWVAMATGHLARYAAGEFTAFHEADGWPMKAASTFARGSADEVFIVDVEKNVHRFREGRFSVLPPPAALPRFNEWMRDASGAEWASGEDQTLHAFRNGRWAPVVPAGDSLAPRAEKLAASRKSGVWIFDGRHIRLLEEGRWTREHLLEPAALAFIKEDSSGHLWVGTSRSKLLRFAPNAAPLMFSSQSGFPHGGISDVCEDREGNIWVASMGSGLIRLRRSVFKTFGSADGLPQEPVLSLAEDSSGRLTLGTLEGGLFVMENRRFFGPLALPGTRQSVWSLHPGRSGGIWAGTYGEGLVKLHGPESAQWTTRHGLVNPAITALYEDRAGALWIGTDAGLSHFDGERFTNYSIADGLPDNRVRAITQDGAGDCWFGTAAGLSRLRDGKFTTFSRKEGLAGKDTRALLADTNGVLWIGTLDGGLSRFKDGRFVNYAAKDGLPDDAITTILDDGLGYLWLGTGRGICRVAHVQLDAFAHGASSRVECATYLKIDGLASSQCSGGNPSGIKSRDGRLWFATDRGVSVVDPREVRSNPVPPPVVIEEVSIDGAVAYSNRSADDLGKHALPRGALEVPAGRRHIEIAYTGLCLTSPAQTRFRVYLAGFDDDWRDFGTRRIAYYDGLSPGTYRFHVEAANNDGVWSDSAATFAFTVLPYYWQAWWFQGGAVAGIGGMVLLSFRRRIVRIERERTAEALRLQGAALACAGNGIVITDRDANIVWSNPAFTRLTGYPAIEIAGRNVRLLKSGQHPVEFYAAMWKTLLAGEVWQGEIVNRQKDGSLATHEQTTTPVFDKNGKISHFIAIKRDITERKWMEKALRDSEDRFRTLAHATLEGIVIFDELAVLEVNPATAEIFGYTQAELIGKSVLELAEAGSRELLLEHIRSHSEKAFESTGQRKDASRLDIEIRCRDFPFQGRLVRAAAIRDITETRRAQTRIQFLEQQKALEAERSRIARDMHDEMGASLTKITLLSEAAELEMASRNEAERQSAAARLQRISTLGRTLVASMDEIVWAVNPGNDSIEEFASYLCHFAPELLKLASIQCRLDVPGVLPQRTLRSEARHHLFLVVKEALHNVIKHSGASHVTLKLEIQPASLTITIHDNGRGIEADEKRRFGNGLRNMRQRMEQIDGEIEIASQPGHGTRVTVRVDLNLKCS